MRGTVRRTLGLLLVLGLATAGCTGYSTYRQARVAEQVGDWDQAVLHYLELVEQDPGHIEYRAGLLRAKIQASQYHFELGKQFHDTGNLARAMVEYRKAVELDATNQYAAAQLIKVREEIQAQRDQRSVMTLDEMKEEARRRSQPPVLNPRSTEPISLDFPKPVSVQDIYRALGKAFGINVLFDPNLKDQQIAIELKDVTPQDALEILMRAAGHFYKVLDEHTILIAADTPQNRRAYEDLVIQTFFLSNAEVKDVMTMLRSLVDAKKVAANDQLNAIIMRDTADKVKVADRIIQVNDKAKAEVVVDVELMQLNTSKMQDLGLTLDPYRVTSSLDLGGEDVPLRLSDLEHLNQNNWAITIPSFIYDFMKSNTEAQTLAKPQLRITEGEKASLHIGDRVPIPTTTFNTSNTVGGNIVPVTSFQYTDVGIKIDIEPRVHHNLEITLKVRVEISNLGGSVQGSGGQEQPIISTRTIETTIRLKDGETNFLAGLLRTDEGDDSIGVPGLAEIPLLGRLFSKTSQSHQRTDVILTMTPHIIRKSDITEEDLKPIWVGTESNITFRGGSPRVESDVGGPFDAESDSAERVRELIRQRVRQLPRGIGAPRGQGQEQDEEEKEPPQGMDLAPTGGPSSIFDQDEEDGGGEGNQSRLVIPPAPSDQLAAVPVSMQEAPVVATAQRSGGVTLRLVPGELEVNAGDRFEVQLVATADRPLSHLPLTLTWNPEVLGVAGWERGEFLGPEGSAQLMAVEGRPGQLLLGASRLGSVAGVEGRGVVARITFEAKAPGEASIGFAEVRALDRELEELGPVGTAPANVEVRPAVDAKPPKKQPRV